MIGTLCALAMATLLAGCSPDGAVPQTPADQPPPIAPSPTPPPAGDTPPPAEQGSVIGDAMGVQVQSWYLGPNDLSSIEAAGFGTLRWGIEWSQVERVQGVYDWAATDAWVQRLRATGLRSIVILAYGNTLYSGGGNGTQLPFAPATPQARAAFARFAAAAARRYADLPIDWEIWNEPDSPIFWTPLPDHAGYAALAAETCAAIKAADPSAEVIGAAGAALPNSAARQPSNLYSVLAQSSALPCLDAISGHAYRMNADYTSPGPDGVIEDIAASKTYLYDTLGVPSSKPFYLTEWGWPTSVVPPDLQVAYIMRGTLASLASDVAMTVWYEWQDSRTPNAGHEAYFGLHAYDGQAKASQRARESLAAFAKATFIEDVDVRRADGRATFVRRDGATYVYAWLNTADTTYAANLIVDGRNMGPVDYFPRAYEVGSTEVSIEIADG